MKIEDVEVPDPWLEKALAVKDSIEAALNPSKDSFWVEPTELLKFFDELKKRGYKVVKENSK